jgi:hypothetical protein
MQSAVDGDALDIDVALVNIPDGEYRVCFRRGQDTWHEQTIARTVFVTRMSVEWAVGLCAVCCVSAQE